MHLEASETIRLRFMRLMNLSGHVVVSHADYKSAIEDPDDYDLYVVGYLNGVHGPDFLLEKVMQGKKVLVLSEIQKLSKIPFASLDVLSNSKALLNRLEDVVTGGK